MRPTTQMLSQRKPVIEPKKRTSLVVQLNEEYAMKTEKERLKRPTAIKEIFSCTMVSPTMKNFYNFSDLVALSKVNFSRGDSLFYPLEKLPDVSEL